MIMQLHQHTPHTSSTTTSTSTSTSSSHARTRPCSTTRLAAHTTPHNAPASSASSASRAHPPHTNPGAAGIDHLTRRAALLLAAPAGVLLSALAAQASVPEISAPGLWGLPFSLGPPPDPVRFPRKNLNLRFAVLLMRSSFDAVRELSFIPMDAFEARFWKLRQSEAEGYNYLYSPLKPRIGDLTDPLYFDFISFSQYATISREMSATPLPQSYSEYREVCPPGAGEDDPCEAGTQLVQRPPRFADDAQLPRYFVETAGDLIYQGLLNGFQGETFGGPPPPQPGASIQQLAAGVQQLLDSMVNKGYAISASVSDVQAAGGDSDEGASRGSFTVRVEGPCNLWALSALKARNAKVINAYDVMVIAAWLRSGGLAPASPPRVEVGESGLEERWVL